MPSSSPKSSMPLTMKLSALVLPETSMRLPSTSRAPSPGSRIVPLMQSRQLSCSQPRFDAERTEIVADERGTIITIFMVDRDGI
jgi:hypothetical protein